MRICIDARNMKPPGKGYGQGRYGYNLIRNLAELDHKNEYVIVKNRAYQEKVVVQENFQEVYWDYDIASIQTLLLAARVINKLHADVYHSLFNFLPENLACQKKIITLHDLLWYESPSLVYKKAWAAAGVKIFARIFMRRAVLSADRIIAISETTRQKILSLFPISAEKVTVVHHGVDEFFRDGHGGATPLPERFQGKRMIFSLGHTRPYKNIPRVIRAFKAIATKFPDAMLVLAGRADDYQNLNRMLAELGLAQQSAFTGPLDDGQLTAFYKQAAMLVFPSLIEGFGAPVIEAMASRCPVITSNRPPMSEIASDAALLVNPYDVGEIAGAMERLLTDARFKQDVIEKGVRRSDQFSWARCAKKTWDVYCG
jgi:glycosyltransferase involved in cell wall biosynthesis